MGQLGLDPEEDKELNGSAGSSSRGNRELNGSAGPLSRGIKGTEWVSWVLIQRKTRN